MKKKIVCSSLEQGINFSKESFKKILDKAKRENKLIFLHAYTTSSGAHEVMKRDVFSLKNIGNFYNSNFINIEIDMEKGEGIDISKKYNIKNFPSFLFINGEGEEIHRIIGSRLEEDFMQLGMDSLDPSKNLFSLKKQFEIGNRQPGMLLELAKLTQSFDSEFSEKVSQVYFEEYPNRKIGEEEIGLLFCNDSLENSPLLKIADARKDEVEAVLGKDGIANYRKNSKISRAILSAYNNETLSYDYIKLKDDLLTIVDEEEAEDNINEIKLLSFLETDNYDKFEEFALEIYNDNIKLDSYRSYRLNNISWIFFEHVSNKNSLQKAIEWAKLSIEKDENTFNTNTLANLYNKIGDKNNAKFWAEKSIELAKKDEYYFDDSQKLLDSL